ncbi:MAG: DUF2130 domain-containing protein [Bacteroidota bacterium]|nr:DUF2130 domain-containing protein [Bacteroidota bacterium]MDP3144167.1 DUF2130 domain-containing protein [Bacteroidota bacterium]
MSQKIEDDIKARYLKRYNEDRQKFELEKALLAKEAELIKTQGENQEQILADKLRLAKNQLEQEAIKKAASEMALQMEMLNKELTEKSQKLKESQVKELELMQKEKQIKEREETLMLDLEKQLVSRQKEIEDRVKKMESERSDFKIKELEKKLTDQAELVETMRRKVEQGSMQLQGEVLELALEELLKSTFPTDTIEEVAKGVKGADCVQYVKNNLGQECGKIIYESKRTKAFTNEWIEKLKKDMRAQQADIAVIVTETLPKDMDAFGFKDGVWICRFSDVKPLSFLLRDSLLKIQIAMISQENKGDKMQMLYNYLTANEFKQNIEAVVEGFLALKDGITREKVQMEKIWKEREKQLDKVLLNTTQFYGSIKGIAGNAVGDLKMLE